MPRTEWYLVEHVVRTNAAARLQPIARHAFRHRSRHPCVLIRGMACPASRHRGDSGARRAGDDDDHVAPAASPAEYDHRRRIQALVGHNPPSFVTKARRTHEEREGTARLFELEAEH